MIKRSNPPVSSRIYISSPDVPFAPLLESDTTKIDTNRLCLTGTQAGTFKPLRVPCAVSAYRQAMGRDEKNGKKEPHPYHLSADVHRQYVWCVGKEGGKDKVFRIDTLKDYEKGRLERSDEPDHIEVLVEADSTGQLHITNFPVSRGVTVAHLHNLLNEISRHETLEVGDVLASCRVAAIEGNKVLFAVDGLSVQ